MGRRPTYICRNLIQSLKAIKAKRLDLLSCGVIILHDNSRLHTACSTSRPLLARFQMENVRTSATLARLGAFQLLTVSFAQETPCWSKVRE